MVIVETVCASLRPGRINLKWARTVAGSFVGGFLAVGMWSLRDKTRTRQPGQCLRRVRHIIVATGQVSNEKTLRKRKAM